MIKIPLSGNIIRASILGEPEMPATKIEIIYGVYDHSAYSHLVISGEMITLDGADPRILSTNARWVELSIPGPLDIASEAIDNSYDVYVSGINAVPEGMERTILSKILGESLYARLREEK